MLTRIRSAVAGNGKAPEALRWVQAVAARQNGRDANLHAEVHQELFGDAFPIHYITHHADYAACERWGVESSADAELQRLFARGEDTPPSVCASVTYFPKAIASLSTSVIVAPRVFAISSRIWTTSGEKSALTRRSLPAC
jgi:hypothetical protein